MSYDFQFYICSSDLSLEFQSYIITYLLVIATWCLPYMVNLTRSSQHKNEFAPIYTPTTTKPFLSLLFPISIYVTTIHYMVKPNI